MLAAERQSRILNLLRQRRSARVGDLAQELEVSEVTIRRDLDALARENLISKVHGGATLPLPPRTEEPGFEAKRHLHQIEKEAIALAAKQFIRPGSAIGLGAGTTTWALAHLLRDIPDLIVVTNSPSIAEVLALAQLYGGTPDLMLVTNAPSTAELLAPAPQATDDTVVLTGGIRTPADALVGPLAVRALGDFNLDAVFSGVHGMHPDSGFTTPNLLEAETNRAFIAAAGRTVVLADHTKWATPGLARFSNIETADALITDWQLSEPAQNSLSEALHRTGSQLIVAVPNGEL